jgi:hypothetical protein
MVRNLLNLPEIKEKNYVPTAQREKRDTEGKVTGYHLYHRLSSIKPM